MIGYILLGLVIILVLYGISAYNGFITFRNRVKNAWAQIDVQLKNRADLIPNLVETVKGYASHEKDTLEQIVKARSGVLNANSPEESMEANDILSQALNRLMVVVEAYPELKANSNFLSLQEDLRGVEEKIRYSRQFYNDTVLKFNTRIQTFPNNIVAGIFGFREEAFFRVDEGDRQVPEVRF
jgi:LemA protein